jgi:phytoene dehydrogenase-like protein
MNKYFPKLCPPQCGLEINFRRIRNNPLVRNNELNLRDYGYGEYIESDPVIHIPFLDGASISVWRDLDHTCEEIGRISKKGHYGQ